MARECNCSCGNFIHQWLHVLANLHVEEKFQQRVPHIVFFFIITAGGRGTGNGSNTVQENCLQETRTHTDSVQNLKALVWRTESFCLRELIFVAFWPLFQTFSFLMPCHNSSILVVLECAVFSQTSHGPVLLVESVRETPSKYSGRKHPSPLCA